MLSEQARTSTRERSEVGAQPWRHAVTFGMSTIFDAAISFKLGAPCASSTAGGNA
jgi:hypothetical protein